MKKVAVSIVGLAFLTSMSSHARLMRAWSYDQLTKEADIVVIGKVTGTKTLDDRTGLANISPRVEVIGVETTFSVSAVLKGQAPDHAIVLHHYKLAPGVCSLSNGPLLVSFFPDDKQDYLLFLKHEESGRFVAVSGQVDPAISRKKIPSVWSFGAEVPAPIETNEFPSLKLQMP